MVTKLRSYLSFAPALLCAAALLASVACGKSETPGNAPAAAPSSGPIHIAVAGPMTGDLAQFGESLKNGAQLAVDEINGGEGVLGRKIEIVIGDDQAQVNEGVNVARTLVRDPRKIAAVIGHFNSGVSKPAGEIYNAEKIVMLSPASTNPSVTSPDRPFVFRNLPNDAQNGELLGQFLASDLAVKKVAIYFANNEYGKGLAEVVRGKLKSLGVEIVAEANYDPNADEDFRPTLTKWKSAKLDAIVLAGETPKAAQLIKQARELGIKAPFAGGDGIASSELWTIGKSAAEGTYVVSYFHPGNPDPEVQKFVAAYKSKHSREPDVWAAQAYDAMRVIASAITKAGAVDPSAIRDALAATDGWKGVTGPHRFKNGDAVGKRVIITVVAKTEGGHQFAFHKEVTAEAAN